MTTEVLDWDRLHADCRILAERITALGRSWQGLIAVTRGGMVPAALLAYRLNIRLIDTLCVASYDHRNQGAAALLKVPPGNGTGWLLVEDLVDTGATARLARARLPGACYAALYAKPAGRAELDLYVRDVPQDTWVSFPWEADEAALTAISDPPTSR